MEHKKASLHFIAYSAYSLFIITQAKTQRGFNDEKRLKSLFRISVLLIALTLVYSIHIVLIAYGDQDRNSVIDLVVIVDFLLFTILFIELVRHPELLHNSKLLSKKHLKTSPFVMAEDTQDLIPKEIFNLIDQKIEALVDKKKFFAKSKSNFDLFSRAIGHSKYHIRSYLKIKTTSFMALKNKCRIQMAQDLLLSENRYTIEYIAQKSGFDSLPNFFKIFKKSNNCTPDEYRKMKRDNR
ncbi:MAG: helix-turn-helix domain-containing protein [Flavobacteriaceae bacterium]|nr:helix-turn-helix domain-containing protein [Flavobacteriaceae bacterium]